MSDIEIDGDFAKPAPQATAIQIETPH